MTRNAAQAAPAGAPDTDTQDIDDFIYLMSHDVRASVRALLELPQWIAEDLAEAGVEITGSVAQSIEMMNRHTARLDRMLMDLLTYSRVGRMQPVVRVDVGAALEEVLSELHLPETMQLSRDIGCAHVMMGEQDALLLWSALIGNSVKHHHATRGTITVTTQQEGALIRFTVCDDGPGIPKRFHSRALGAMTTLRPRDEVEGTGMGLANVRKLAEHYGGYVALSEVDGESSGLRIDVVIPHGCPR
ncbi:ATP-binding protein [uncultured Sulfitobacter sp.]|uniref:sensor histidine kinase n=1 Tax=uncultured Sulfitobacter sp. TaxID=191468 RepID=UPI002631C55E|nr:ATP-binding protein [uncultured Sulfitobacter sp.]